MCWIKVAEKNALIKWGESLWTKDVGYPDCTNYPGVHWKDVHLDCSATGQLHYVLSCSTRFVVLLYIVIIRIVTCSFFLYDLI